MSRVLFGLIVLGIAVAVLRVVVVALVVALAIALLLSFITRPRETFTGLLVLALCGLASAQPVACIVTLGILALVAMAIPKPRQQVLLTDDRQID